DVRFMGIPDGAVTVEFTRQVIHNLAGENEGEASFVGHAPKDSYAGFNCGHPDHCAVATALTQAHSEGQIKGLKLYRIGQLMGGAQAGTCQQLTSDQMAAKQAMRTQYTIVRTGEGRYGIAGQSVPGAWAATRSKPECFDNPSP
ncbi:hypothetical protein HYZ70_01060, partial [Candidatus Curtissbacteria bacterium]|nr:hypothetical protein [Candidatus Curtissbacteria bacterium]